MRKRYRATERSGISLLFWTRWGAKSYCRYMNKIGREIGINKDYWRVTKIGEPL